jgi:hypothetical protein
LAVNCAYGLAGTIGFGLDAKFWTATYISEIEVYTLDLSSRSFGKADVFSGSLHLYHQHVAEELLPAGIPDDRQRTILPYEPPDGFTGSRGDGSAECPRSQ